jgi:hypothetical protein
MRIMKIITLYKSTKFLFRKTEFFLPSTSASILILFLLLQLNANAFSLKLSNLVSANSFLQAAVRGTVKDQNGVAIAGATVKVKGANTVTVTNATGVFFYYF